MSLPVFFHWDISVICPITALKLDITVFTSIPFPWPNWIRSLWSFQKNFCLCLQNDWKNKTRSHLGGGQGNFGWHHHSLRKNQVAVNLYFLWKFTRQISPFLEPLIGYLMLVVGKFWPKHNNQSIQWLTLGKKVKVLMKTDINLFEINYTNLANSIANTS